MRPLARLSRALRLEDVLLALLTGIVLPLLGWWLGAGGRAGLSSSEPSALDGLVGLVAIVGVVVCVLTRGPDEPVPFDEGSITLQGWARFPLGAGVAVVAVTTLPGIGLDGGLVIGLAFLAVFIGFLAHARLPVIGVEVRRGLVLPMTIVAAGAFDAIARGGLGDVATSILAAGLEGSPSPEGIAVLPLALAGIAIFYVMLVIAPRSIADPGASAWAWIPRFLLLLASVMLSAVLGIA